MFVGGGALLSLLRDLQLGSSLGFCRAALSEALCADGLEGLALPGKHQAVGKPLLPKFVLKIHCMKDSSRQSGICVDLPGSCTSIFHHVSIGSPQY